MKKFSKLILESKDEARTMSPCTNPVDWEEIFKPLIEHIENNLQSKVQGPGSAVFTNKTKALLDEFIDQVEEDYKDYFQYEIHDGSQESFLQIFNINVDYKDIMDCIQPLLDRTEDVEDSGNFDFGAFVIDIVRIKYNTNEEIAEDLADVHGKLKMLDADFSMKVVKSEPYINASGYRESGTTTLKKNSTDVDSLFLKDLENDEKITNVVIYVYNKETVQAADLDDLHYVK
jgi:hypothetical protein